MIGQDGLVQRAHQRIALLLRQLAQTIDVSGGGRLQITVRWQGDLVGVLVGLGGAEPGSGTAGSRNADGDDPHETHGDHFLGFFAFCRARAHGTALRSTSATVSSPHAAEIMVNSLVAEYPQRFQVAGELQMRCTSAADGSVRQSFTAPS